MKRRRKRISPSRDSTSEATSYALRLLSIRGRSELELRERLQRKGFDGDTIAHTVESLKCNGYINDSALSEQLISYALDKKGLGIRGVRDLLAKRGIPDTMIKTLGLEGIDELVSAERLAEKKLRGLNGLSSRKAMGRLYGMLKRRGYSSETVRTVLRNIFSGDVDF